MRCLSPRHTVGIPRHRPHDCPLLAQLPSSIDQAAADLVAVHATARRHNLSSYQASYLDLAERRALVLATRRPRPSPMRRA
ncbi:MAG: hypothetical protein QOG01_2493 [Pseudonocardiales bacterium]|jgi:hypothetical protein|nr:hypothetical protein [Pseudonocardiales bacterium]